MFKSKILKRVLSIYLLFLLITAGFIGLLVFEGIVNEGGVEGATLYVGQGQPYTTIGAAITAANPWDNIIVYSGTYNENIEIDKALTLIGNASTNTIINGGGSGDVVKIEADWVNITGFTITGSGPNYPNSGINLNDVQNCSIINNNCSNNRDGIFMSISSNNMIENNICNSNNLCGMYITESNYNTISNNTCNSNNGDGISVVGISNTAVNNTCNSNWGDGIGCAGESNLLINNTCNSNHDDGIILSGDSNKFINNICNSNYDDGLYLYGISNIVRNNKFNSNWDDGIYLDRTNSNLMANNTCNSNMDNGIYLISSNSNTIWNNTCKSNKNDGIFINNSLDNIISNNTCNLNYYNGIHVLISNSNTIVDNICTQKNKSGILLSKASNCIIKENTMEYCGIFIQGDSLDQWNTHTIDITNTVNGRPVYYWKDQISGIIPLGAGEVILANCSNIQITNQILNYTNVGIILGFTLNSKISSTICSNNNFDGTHLYLSTGNIFDNCTFFSNKNSDIHLEENSKNNIAINSTFNIVYNEGFTSELIIKNYLHIQVNHTENFPVEDADLLVKENDKVIYATPGYGGVNAKTNNQGQIKWILVTDRTYYGGIAPVKNIISVNVKFDDNEAINNNREVNITSSHFEYFIVNYTINVLPNKVILESPYNNSFINNTSQLLLKWKNGTDENGDILSYNIQINDLDDDWESLVLDRNIGDNELRYAYNFLRDGIYQWHVRAHDGFGFGPWSDIWKFTVDTIPPEISILINNDDKYTNNVNVSLNLSAQDSGSGVTQMAFSTDNRIWSEWEEYNNTHAFNLQGGDGEKVVYFRVQDKAGNIAIPIFDIIILDTTPPKNLSITINNNDLYTKSKQVVLDLYATDLISGINKMFFSSNNFTWTQEELFNFKKTLSLSDGDGKKIIYFTVSDKIGNIAEPVSDYIFLDTTPPHSLSISINDGAFVTNSSSITLNLSALDNLSGVNQMTFSNDGINWSSWENYSDLKLYTLPSGDGVKVIYFKVKDNAGNIADPISATILLNTTSPEIDKTPDKDEKSPNLFYTYANYWFFLILVIIIIISILIVIQLIRKRKKEQESGFPTVEAVTVKPTTSIISEIASKQPTVQQTIIQQPTISSGYVITAPIVTSPTAEERPSSTATITPTVTPIPEAQAQAPTLPQTLVTPEFQLPKVTLTKEQQLHLLRERFLKGEVTEETYKKLRTEIETQTGEDITKDEQEDQVSEIEPQHPELSEQTEFIKSSEIQPIIQQPTNNIQQEEILKEKNNSQSSKNNQELQTSQEKNDEDV